MKRLKYKVTIKQILEIELDKPKNKKQTKTIISQLVKESPPEISIGGGYGDNCNLYHLRATERIKILAIRKIRRIKNER